MPKPKSESMATPRNPAAARPDDARTAEADNDPGLVSMADLLIGTTATLLLVVLALAPQLGTVARPLTGPPNAEPATSWPSSADEPVLFAADRRLTGFGYAAGLDLSLDEIAAFSLDPSSSPLLVIAHGGHEAAFLTEARLSALGITTVRRVRLPPECSRVVFIGEEGVSCE